MSKPAWKTSKLNKTLKQKFSAGPERGGLVLNDGTVVELTNICSDPTQGFTPDLQELLPFVDRSVATWHTHPGATANLSSEDWETFVEWPDHLHAIAGTDGLRWYAVKGSAVVNA